MPRPAQSCSTETLRPDDPRQVGRYQILALLGEGGMGRVLLGVGPDGRLAAVKQVHPRLARTSEFRARFEREVTASRQLTGAYTAAVLDADLDADHPWLATAFINGLSLSAAVTAAGPFPEPALQRLITGLALALNEIHRSGLIHRDLNPGNVVLTDDSLRVIDFGIAGLADGASDLTETASTLGVPGHFSPEQAEGRSATPASDVFAMGTLLVLAATGTNPFTAGSAAQALYRVVHHQPDLRVLPPELRRVAEHCLEKDPARRPTAADVLHGLPPIHPSTRPWPETVHGTIAEQRMGIKKHTHRAARPQRHGRLATGILAVVTSLLVGTTVGVVAAANDSDESQAQSPPVTTTAPSPDPTPDPLTLETLRTANACSLLSEALGEQVPDDDAYPAFDACNYQNAAGIGFRLGIGVQNGEGRPTGALEGLPFAKHTSEGGHCRATVHPPSTRGRTVDLEVYPDASCQAAEVTLGAVLRTLRTPRQEPAISQTLATIDPCSVVAETTASQLLDEQVYISSSALHQCIWKAGRRSASLSLGLLDEYSTSHRQVDLAGRTAYLLPSSQSNATTCTLTWVHRHLDKAGTEIAEAVKVKISDDRPQACDIAERFAQAVLPNLPTT